MQEQIIILQNKDKAALGAVRCIAGLQAAVQGGQIWVRGIDAATKDLRVQQLPSMATCRLGEDDLLFPNDKITPVGKLPDLQWESLETFITVEPPVSAMPGEVQDSLPVHCWLICPYGKNMLLLLHKFDWKVFNLPFLKMMKY